MFKANLWVLTLLFGAFSLQLNAQVENTEAEKVASALPILHLLNQSLLQGTGVESVYLPPSRLPVPRINNWLQHKSEAVLAKHGSIAALVTVESIWPQYALFKHLRKGNVRVVPVDAAQEILSGGAQVSLTQADIEQVNYFWLAPDNLRVMGQIMARDFQRIWPEHAGLIRQNQLKIQQQVSQHALQLDEILLDHDINAVCVSNNKLLPLARVTYLPVEPQCDAALEIRIITKKTTAEKGVWLVNPGHKPVSTGLAAWLTDNLTGLKAAVAN